MSARQGADILMALVHAELTWQFSTPCQSSNYRLIDFKFVVGDYVPGTRTLLSFVFVGKPVAAPGGGDIYGSCDFFVFVSRDRVPSKPVDRFLHIVA